ncbi:MAG TPA: TIM-barrel domain-containing protein [Bryobacteraceae bacterium]|nr:TIM-barrel domain-containing protein [Bryobacteraceae bacterium]
MLSFPVERRKNLRRSLHSVRSQNLRSAAALLGLAFCPHLFAQSPHVVLTRTTSTVVLEPYAANIIRVTMSLNKERALAGPGYGITAHPSASMWSFRHNSDADVYTSPRLVVSVGVSKEQKPSAMAVDIAKYFTGSAPPVPLSIKTPSGKSLVQLKGWSMAAPNHKDGNASILRDKRPSDAPFYRVGAVFDSPLDEHYYGLGQNQEAALDHRGRRIECWQNYDATAGPSICVPFLVTNRGYAIIWDNPSKTVIEPGFNEQTRWTSEVGDRVSFFLIAGDTTDELYAGYRQLTGATPLLPKAAYGYIQSKMRYRSQDEVLSVAQGYRDRRLPLDMIMIDWFYGTKMGQFDFDHVQWPDPAAMNRKLHDMGIQTMISVWPRFEPGSRYYDLLRRNGWLMHLADGTPTNGLPYDRAGSDIDTTNPQAAQWYWRIIRDNILSKGFDSLWCDQTEPDLPPNGSFFSIGSGTRFFNIYPLLHTAALYEGFRRDLKRRALILARDAYLGAQRNGTMFWSSDIYSTWDTFQRQVSTGLGFTASGMAYWSSDIGGWEPLPPEHHPLKPPLLDPSDARDNIGGYDDFPELYTRWFEYGAFVPIFRSHGSRLTNEIWSYGKAAQPILEKYLKLRYQLMPYIYSLAHLTNETGAPYMRALFMDFPKDPLVATIGDEYMFGPAFLVAPVTEQGATSRKVYLPAGTDWYNYWTKQRIQGGQTITAEAPIDTLPLFVKAGSIVPMGEPVESTKEPQKLARLQIYRGADADFTLYNDDGTTYRYERGEVQVTRFHWNDSGAKVSHDGFQPWSDADSAHLEVIGR